MLDIKFIRENNELVKKSLEAKNVKADLNALLSLDDNRKKICVQLDDLRAKTNAANNEIGKLIKEKKEPKEKIASMKKIAGAISELEPQLKDVERKMQDILLNIPNIAHSTVRVGGEDKNEIVRRWGEPKQFDFKPKNHIDIAESLGMIDFKRAAKIAGSNFIVYKKDGARLERALFNFMLSLHTKEHGYTEIFPPFLVNRISMTGTGQLPKMEEDMYKLEGDDLFLIPTAEVPVTNLHAQEVLAEEGLPIKYTAYTACFRREAGSYGKDTRGLMRVHQFNKVELVKFVKPEDSYDELEKLLNDAEKVLQVLDLPYRVKALATGDLSFAAAKTYDLEAYSAGMDKWLEVSSCSNFEDFQARRAGIRFKGKETKKATFVHTLNGSGLALARTMIAILENYQTIEGDVIIPKSLRPFMDGQERITN